MVLVLAVFSLGVINIYSAGHSMLLMGDEPYYIKQLKWIGVGFIFLLVFFLVDYWTITRYAYILYAISIILLIIVSITGNAVHGAQRWLSFAGFNFQPSELSKLTLILVLASFFESRGIEEKQSHHNLIVPILLLALPFILILMQPHLGNALILAMIFLFIVIFVGVERRFMIVAGCAILAVAPFFWYLLEDYQKRRIVTFLDPERDPLGTGFQTIQSMIAVGSGQLTGRGFLAGSQSQLAFLPEQHTDFVFSVLAEEWGFAGAALVLILLFTLISKGFKIAAGARDVSGAVIAYGITVLIALGVFVNIGMVLGILPVVGVPLPFFSYGGSVTLVLMIGLGLLFNVSARRSFLYG